MCIRDRPMRARDRTSGELLWTSEGTKPWRGLAAGDDLVLAITDGAIEAREPATGRIRWTTRTEGRCSGNGGAEVEAPNHGPVRGPIRRQHAAIGDEHPLVLDADGSV